MRTALFIALCALCLATRLARLGDVVCHDPANPQAPPALAYVDSDCYTRMERARQVYLDPFHPVLWHGFENHPIGIRAHTTAPLDYVIAGLAWALTPFLANPVDWSGVLISPILALVTLALMWWWTGLFFTPSVQLWSCGLFCLLPMTAFSQNIGRPDHQALLLLLLTAALALEPVMTRYPGRRAPQVAGGLAWGVALWTSLYEPAILFVACVAVQAILRKGEFFAARPWWWGTLGTTLCMATFVDGNPLQPNPAAFATHLLNLWFKAGIGELVPLTDWRACTLFFGLWVYGLPAIVWFGLRRRKADRRNVALFGTLAALSIGMGLMQARWAWVVGIFICLFAVPLLVGMRGVVWQHAVALLLSAPLLIYHAQAAFARTPNDEYVRLARLATSADKPGGIMAPWWLSPIAMYASGQPSVASSSHESIAGIVDSCHFFASTRWPVAKEILDRREVRWIIVTNPAQIISQSVRILGWGTYDEKQAARMRDYPKMMATRLQKAAQTPPQIRLRHVIGEDLLLYEYTPDDRDEETP